MNNTQTARLIRGMGAPLVVSIKLVYKPYGLTKEESEIVEEASR